MREIIVKNPPQCVLNEDSPQEIHLLGKQRKLPNQKVAEDKEP